MFGRNHYYILLRVLHQYDAIQRETLLVLKSIRRDNMLLILPVGGQRILSFTGSRQLWSL